MSGNPKTSQWYATPRANRVSKGIEVTLTEAEHARLEALKSASGLKRARVIGALLMSPDAERILRAAFRDEDE